MGISTDVKITPSIVAASISLGACAQGLRACLAALISSHGRLILAVLVAGGSAGLPLPGETKGAGER
jgi:hypothetical protein